MYFRVDHVPQTHALRLPRRTAAEVHGHLAPVVIGLGRPRIRAARHLRAGDRGAHGDVQHRAADRRAHARAVGARAGQGHHGAERRADPVARRADRAARRQDGQHGEPGDCLPPRRPHRAPGHVVEEHAHPRVERRRWAGEWPFVSVPSIAAPLIEAVYRCSCGLSSRSFAVPG